MRSTSRPTLQHREVAREAGYRRVSLLSTLAGTMCLYGTVAVAAVIVAPVLSRSDVELTTDDLVSSGFAATLVASAVLLLAALFGGYVAGRMARRSGILHGVAVVIGTLVVGAVLAAFGSMSQGLDLSDDLRDIGIPTAWDDVQDVALVGLLVAAAALILGSVLGGLLGERWHTKLARRVDDPAYGPEAEERARIEADARRRREEDDLVRADADAERARRLRSDEDRDLVVDQRRDDDRPVVADRESIDLRDRPTVTDDGDRSAPTVDPRYAGPRR